MMYSSFEIGIGLKASALAERTGPDPDYGKYLSSAFIGDRAYSLILERCVIMLQTNSNQN
jgi:hypothetical protein